MRQQRTIGSIYNMVSDNMGKKVVVKTNQGRNRYDVAEGIIEEMHPHVFCVRFGEKGLETSTRTSYSYTDVLIRDVELVF